ncbi:hypothetical protein P171DRAFT_413724 [Karstenula rhodostoma CBS 690.94]|uniref:Uncharacterized protein n=1 Tax=Karstenula rhodostoma CBS 690.94 TaxID=1392251 RepID=A0A9P4PFD8_9PLEO|nr:hypothetical protein P171DRAFT_413724 [Karstenula rhodostoma CBS 690.94]
MSPSQPVHTAKHHITPPSSFAVPSLMPPPTDKPFAQVHRVIALFEDIQAGGHTGKELWKEYQLGRGEYEALERQLHRDETLLGYVKDKIRYDYDVESRRIAVRMPSAVHELFTARVEDAILSQLKLIREESGEAASFARKVHSARSTAIYFPIDGAPSGTTSKHEPDASFWHTDAKYPGVILEVACLQKRKKLSRLAENYLLDSNASVRVVVGLDIEYGENISQKATVSVWRTHIVRTPNGNELRVVQEVKDAAFRDDHGNPSDHGGLRLRLQDFAYEELAHRELGDEDKEVSISTRQLCEYLDAAETMVERSESLGEHKLGPGVKKRKRSETPPEDINSSDEARYVEQEVRAAKRGAEDDPDYDDNSQ